MQLIVLTVLTDQGIRCCRRASEAELAVSDGVARLRAPRRLAAEPGYRHAVEAVVAGRAGGVGEEALPAHLEQALFQPCSTNRMSGEGPTSFQPSYRISPKEVTIGQRNKVTKRGRNEMRFGQTLDADAATSLNLK